MPKAPLIDQPELGVPRSGFELGSKSVRALEASAYRSDDERKAEARARTRVAHCNGRDLMHQVERFTGAQPILDPTAGPRIKLHIAGFEHAVETLPPSHNRKIQPFDNSHSRQLQTDGLFVAFSEGQERNIMPL